MELDQSIFFLIAVPVFVVFVMLAVDFMLSLGKNISD